MDINYEDCLKFIEKTNRISLFPYQKIMLHAMCQGIPVSACRCAGKTMIAKGIGDYIAKKLDEPCCDGIAFPYTVLMKEVPYVNEAYIAGIRALISPEQFKKEYALDFE